ncbi:MAG TPA: gephyrin-like molybdotransferase Glp [Vicinamibacterales bacterium]|nr:gephyrin-like molybdotransferase Glp [Vicinamibacterales bacterium]
MEMRPFQSTIPLTEAQDIISAAIRPLDRTETVPLSEVRGRVLARDVLAPADVPPFARAAMDGYAVRAADTTGASRDTPVLLRRIETIYTGQMPVQAVAAGLCSEVATGAPMPDGADAVVMVEETSAAGDDVQLFAAAAAGQNVGRQGQDIRTGQLVLAAGTMLTASRVGAIAALGHTEVLVYSAPRVAILSTGNEVVAPGEPLAPGQIYDINSSTLAAVVAEHGGVPVIHRTAVDTLEDLSRAVDECLADDLLVFSGGSSVGTRDLMLDVVRAKGEVLFHGIAVKPGKPTAFGRIGGKLAFGMPGYPTSCLTNAYVLLVPVLRRMARLPAQSIRVERLPLAARVSSTPNRHQFYTVRVEEGRAWPAFKASGDITSMSQADGYIEIDADTTVVEAGTLVDVKFF